MHSIAREIFLIEKVLFENSVADICLSARGAAGGRLPPPNHIRWARSAALYQSSRPTRHCLKCKGLVMQVLETNGGQEQLMFHSKSYLLPIFYCQRQAVEESASWFNFFFFFHQLRSLSWFEFNQVGVAREECAAVSLVQLVREAHNDSFFKSKAKAKMQG